jgi:RNA polymerase sigma-70 factor (ECF subfamily)
MEAEGTLLDKAKGMDGDALAEIFDLYSPALFNYALRFCRDALMADHIVGDVFARLLDHLSAGKGPRSNLRSYLFQTAYHLIVDEVRYANRRVSFDLFDMIRYDGYVVFPGVENRILYETISQAMLDDLTDYQRHVIILRFLEGFSLHETAAILGKSVNVIKAAQHHAISTLRKILSYRGVEVTTVSIG